MDWSNPVLLAALGLAAITGFGITIFTMLVAAMGYAMFGYRRLTRVESALVWSCRVGWGVTICLAVGAVTVSLATHGRYPGW